MGVRRRVGPLFLPFREHVLGPFLPARHRPQQVGEPVEVRHHERAVADGLGDGETLGPAHDGAGQIERGGHAVLARHGEVTRHVEAGQQVVDPDLQRATMSGVTRLDPAASFERLAGAVATSAIKT